MSDRRLLPGMALTLAVALVGATPASVVAAPKVIRAPETVPAPKPQEPAQVQPVPAAPRAAAPRPPAAGAPRGTAGTPSATRPSAGTKLLSLPSRRPIVLDALHVEGRTDAPRVLFVHAGPTVALEAAPAHPSYLRDDFTAALSSPVRVRVRAGELARPTTAGGNR